MFRNGFADGCGEAALFSEPEEIALWPGGALFVADSNNHRSVGSRFDADIPACAPRLERPRNDADPRSRAATRTTAAGARVP